MLDKTNMYIYGLHIHENNNARDWSTNDPLLATSIKTPNQGILFN